jgi:hypothetical protein
MNTNEQLVEAPAEKNLALEKRLADTRKTLGYQIAYVQTAYADELWQAMEHRELNQVQLADQAEVSKQFLTKVFRGGNCTIETMVKLAYAANYKVSVHLTPNEIGCAWMHCVTESSPRPPELFIDLWTEMGYRPMVVLRKECEKIAA